MENQMPSASNGRRLVIVDYDSDQMDYDSCSTEGSDDGHENYRPLSYLSHPLYPEQEKGIAFFNGDTTVAADGNKKFVGLSIDQPFPYNKFINWIRDGGLRNVQRTVTPKKWETNDQIIIVFATDRVFELFKDKLDKTFKDKYNEVMQLVWGPAPGQVPCVSSFGSGLVGSVTLTRAFRALELKNAKYTCASILTIPSVPAFDVKSFMVDVEQFRDLTSRTRIWAFKKMLGITTGNVTSLKGIAFFHRKMGQFEETYMTSPLVTCLQDFLRDYPHVAMAGGVSNVMSKGTADDNVAATGFLLFAKNDEVKVSVAAFGQEDVKSRKKITAKLMKLKEGELTRRRNTEQASSFGVIFGSTEGTPIFDGKYFEEIFPRTRIAGGYQSHQFCSARLNEKKNKIELKNATVVFFVSYLSPKNK